MTLVALVVLGSAVSPAVPAGADDPQPWSITFAPTTQLTDGQPVKLTLRTTPEFFLNSTEFHICRPGVAYAGGAERDPAFRLAGPNCPLTPVSSSAESVVADGSPNAGAVSPDGEVLTMRAGIGVVEWQVNGVPASLQCDVDHPCDMVMEVRGGPTASYSYVSQTLTFRNPDPVAGCGGPASGAIRSGGSDRMIDAWTSWTLAACGRPDAHGALTTGAFVGEGNTVQQFNKGELDLAYTAAGNIDEVNLNQDAAAPGPRRDYVAVPIAINAVTLGLGNGRPGATRKVPFRPASLTAAEAAALFAGGKDGLTLDQIGTISRRPGNEDFSPDNPKNAPFFADVPGSQPVQAAAPAEATSWIGTNFFHQLAPGPFSVPDLPKYADAAGQPRGADASLAVADPSYILALDLYSSSAFLSKTLTGMAGSNYGGVWVLSDMVTANELSMTPTALGNASGAFVAPTAESLIAAVSRMQPDASGILQLEPTVSASSGAQPYPLTYVEYAMVPAEPLVDATCTATPESQALLTSWLDYLVSADGQAELSPGMVALTPELQAQAEAAIAQVGTSPLTSCTPPPPADPTPTTTLASGYPTGSGSSGSGGFSSTRAGSSGSGSGSDDGAEQAAVAEAALASSATDIPGWGGIGAPSTLAAVIALIGVALLLGATARASSGRPWNPFRRAGPGIPRAS